MSFVALANDPILGTQCNVPAKTDGEKIGGSEHCSEQSTFLLLLLLPFNINIATVHQQTTGDLKTAPAGLCGDHYSGDEWRVLTQ